MDLISFYEFVDHEKTALFISAFGFITLVLLWFKYRHAYKLRDEFVYIISHKFRTPLSTNKWTLENLIPLINDPLQKKDLNDVYRMNVHLTHLTNTLLELAEKDEASVRDYKFEDVSLSEVVDSVAKSMKPEFNAKNIIFGISIGENVRVKADKARLEFVIQTLLTNALTYTRVAGMVNIVVSETHSKAIVTIEDNGIGIARNDLSGIFHKFHRGKNAVEVDTEGLGVGLYLAKSITRRLKGKLEVKSPGVNRGSTFVLTLPKVR